MRAVAFAFFALLCAATASLSAISSNSQVIPQVLERYGSVALILPLSVGLIGTLGLWCWRGRAARRLMGLRGKGRAHRILNK